ncbi:hypothetical protein CHS0354_008710 [Potamilus streckersoni]|uniref:Neuroendocrine protein 7B2 n=1 Tax=Potamilus streckersoni TaxID=2493646 RepID=A0AAE0SD07_9BIVA|nr:hypothetical protein CHS0354_008710 [Potamilus streckersoni]
MIKPVMSIGLLVALTTFRISGASYAKVLSDLYQLYQIQQLQDSAVKGHDFYDESLENRNQNDDWSASYGDPTLRDPRLYSEAAIRDQEYMKQLPISGYQFISGGNGQNSQAEREEVKSDKVLPAYCTPPNPCPYGYTGDENCLKEFENTPENNRRLLEQQDCPCDAEHMLNCPAGGNNINPKSEFMDLDSLDVKDNPYFDDGQKRLSLVAKKTPHTIRKRETGESFDQQYNPYLEGQKMRRASKKSPPMHQPENHQG